jgi:hypothetical protein
VIKTPLLRPSTSSSVAGDIREGGEIMEIGQVDVARELTVALRKATVELKDVH